MANILNQPIGSAGLVTRAGVYLYSGDTVTDEDLFAFLDDFTGVRQDELVQKMKWYLGEHPILDDPKRGGGRPDNRVVINLPYSNVDTFNGYFIGKNPKITLDNSGANQSLQGWQNTNSFQDKLAEISKQVDIYGHAFALIYQDEDSQTCMTYADPENSFMIYDDTVQQKPLAFVTFSYDSEGSINGIIYYAEGAYPFQNGVLSGEFYPNVYNRVPAVEFIANDERQGLNDQVFEIADNLDHAVSQKANQVEYFDNAYLIVAGLTLPENDDGSPKVDLVGNQMLYAPDADATAALVKFLEKPDGDNMQENHINRLIEQNYNVTGVVNFNDQRISGNITGKALERLLQRMSNRAVFKQTKFTKSLRDLYRVVFSAKNLTSIGVDDWQRLDFKFYENLPADYADEATTAKNLEGIISKQTQLKALSLVDDPKKEIKLMQQEKADDVKQALKTQAAYKTDQESPLESNSGVANDEQQ